MENSCTQLRDVLKDAIARSQSDERMQWHGFWNRPPKDEFPPKSVTYPSEYDGSEKLSIVCTQTDLPAKEQKRLIEEWCSVLPTLNSVKYVWFLSKVSQSLFDAACQMPLLEGLFIKWSSLSTIEPLLGSAQLRYVHIGSSPGIQSIAPVRDLAQLQWLELDNVKLVTDLTPVGRLKNLEGFSFTGAEGRGNVVKSFEPLKDLEQLRWLHLGAIHPEDGSIDAIGHLKNLQWLGIGNYFSTEQFARLSVKLPNTVSSWLKPYDDLGRLGIMCGHCKSSKFMLTGKGAGTICPICSKKKFERHMAIYRQAISNAC